MACGHAGTHATGAGEGSAGLPGRTAPAKAGFRAGPDPREEEVVTPSTGTPRPGVPVGTTSEFSLFFRIRPGHEDAACAAVEELQRTPGYRPGDYSMPIATIHEARFVLFDEGTRLLFATSFDGPWDAYMEDFASKPLQLFDAIFRHVEGYDGLPDIAALKNFVLSAQVTAAAYARNYARHSEGDPEGRAGEPGVPAGARRPRRRAGAAASGPEAAARRGGRLDPVADPGRTRSRRDV